MLVELKLVEQRYRAVIDVLDGMSVTDVARRNGVSRQTRAHVAASLCRAAAWRPWPTRARSPRAVRTRWPRSSRPGWSSCAERTRGGDHAPSAPSSPKTGFTPVPGRSSIYRTLVRHHLLEPTQRKRSRSDYKRWERCRSMELWQMDVVGRFHLADGTEVKVVTGVDDHSRFCICARVVARATARPVCEALQWALRTHGVPTRS